jgi:hypothetical protein
MRATGCPHLFRFKLELASASRLKGACILLLILARSFLALEDQKTKPKANFSWTGSKQITVSKSGALLI